MKQRIPVRTLVEFVLSYGDLHPRGTSKSRAVEGTYIHQWIQKLRGPNYLAEQTLSTTFTEDELTLEIHGRADGVIQKETGFCIEEIKSTSLDLEQVNENHNILHWAQAQCYAYILAEQKPLEEVEVQLTYVQLDSREIVSFNKVYHFKELKVFFINLVKEYLAWARRLNNWMILRNKSIQALKFPYEGYRSGQRDLVKGVYKTIKENQKLFIQAPTGIGKTFGTIFPAIKAFEEGLSTHIIYLTARTIARTVAEESLATLEKQGLAMKYLTLTAKDKICFCPENSCEPEECSFAKGYYDRIRLALEAIFNENCWSRQQIEKYAQKYTVCPFEFSLDLSNWADFIICDYNYVFDPQVSLKHLFLDDKKFTFLVDEAHNLVDRAREMFSAQLDKEEMLELRHMVEEEETALAKRLNTINNHLVKLKEQEQEQELEVAAEAPSHIYSSLEKFIKEVDRLQLKWQKSKYTPAWGGKLLDIYFKILGFLRTSEGYDENYVTYYKKTDRNLTIKLFCVNPSKNLSKVLAQGQATIFFSATLNPIEYFMQILGGDKDSYKLTLDSPFPVENLLVMVQHRIPTTYNKRSLTREQIVECIVNATSAKTGNYIVYFPSYDYLQSVYELFFEMILTGQFGTVEGSSGIRIIKQESAMTEQDREEFLANFEEHPQHTLIAFALMGGIFGEGVDLKGERLSGAIIVSVGLPQLGGEREIIRTHFDTQYHMGFEFAYMYPGMNKVLQAAGRVIRSEKDKGVVLLIDERFAKQSYKRLFPKAWSHPRYIKDCGQLSILVKSFWEESEANTMGIK